MEFTIKLKEPLALRPLVAAAEKFGDPSGIESCTLNTQPIIQMQAEVYFQIED